MLTSSVSKVIPSKYGEFRRLMRLDNTLHTSDPRKQLGEVCLLKTCVMNDNSTEVMYDW
jgi:hypothetical protein